jgi:hypothetical protein
MAAALPFIIAASAGVSAISAIQQGKAAEAAGEYNRVIGDQNAVLSRQEAADQARQADRETFLRLGAVRAAQGKAGGAAGEGSVLDVLGDVAAQSELERQDILYRGELKARGFQNTARLDALSGANAATTGTMRAGAELLGGGAKAYDAFDRTKRPQLTRA